MHEPGGPGTLSSLPTGRQRNVERDLTPDALRVILGESRDEQEEERLARRLRWQSYPVVVALLSALGALGYGAYLKWRTSQAPASVSNVAVLALQAERRGDTLRVSWNRDTPVVNHARGAVLSIRDSDLQPQELHLDFEQLRNGSVVYSPANKSVQFRLEVTGQDNTKTSETTLARAARKAHLTARLVGGSPPWANSSSRNRKSFSHPRSGQDVGEHGRLVLVDPPTQAANLVPEASVLEQLAIAQPKLPPPPEITLTEPAFVAAHAIHESLPNLPRKIRATVISEVEVQINVQVDESGLVMRIDPAGTTGPASGSLVSATEEAARLWRFAPAMRGNQPVASEVVLSFRYTPVKTARN